MPPSAPNSPKLWPSPQDWQAAIQNPQIAFTDSFLKSATPALDRLGLPAVWSGNFAHVFKVANGQERRAIRCFRTFAAARQERYEAIDRQLDAKQLPAMVAFDYDDDGIRVNGSCYPVLVMEWIEGNALDVYVDQVVQKSDVLEYLAEEWVRTIAALDAAGVAHGDLQHGNVLISGGTIRLVDLDGMFVPALKGQRASELGHRAYQHPRRDEGIFDVTIDRFSALVIYVSLKALAVRPELWKRYHDENLIFGRSDYVQPSQSSVFKDVRSIGGQVGWLVDALEQACLASPRDAPKLSDLVVVKESRLPAWMRPVPQGGLGVQTKTREVANGAAPPQSANGTSVTLKPIAAPTPVSVTAPPATQSVQTTRPIGPSWAERFGRGFFGTLKSLWWLLALSLLSGDPTLIVTGMLCLFVLALIVGLCATAFAGAAQPSQRPASIPVSRNPLPATTTAVPKRRLTVASAGIGTGQVVASSIRTIYHRPSCEWALKMSKRNRLFFASPAEAQSHGYRPCRVCGP